MVSIESHRCIRSNILSPIHVRSYSKGITSPLISIVLYHTTYEKSFICYVFQIRIYIKIAKKNLLCEMYIPYQVQQCIRGSLALQANDYLRLLSKLVLNA